MKDVLTQLDNFIWAHPGPASALFTSLSALVTLLIGAPTLGYLIRYTRSTVELAGEAKKQSAIQTESYEASIMPLIVAEFSSFLLPGDQVATIDVKMDSVMLRNIGRGAALGVQVVPLSSEGGGVHFNYIPVIEPGAAVPLVCVKGTPEPAGYSHVQGLLDSERPERTLYQYARSYVLATSDELKIVTKSLSNTTHEFFHRVQLRGSDNAAVLVYTGRAAREHAGFTRNAPPPARS